MEILYEISESDVNRYPTGPCTLVQQHQSTKQRHSTFSGERGDSGEGVIAVDHDDKGVPKFRVGDRVRISKANKEVFTIRNAHPSDPPVYQLDEDLGEMLEGTFYEPEL